MSKLSEFTLIENYFKKQPLHRKDVILGIGDDCALLKVPNDLELAVSMDTLVSGVHFFLETAAKDIGYKALAVNLSDLAAMGATPAWVTLALTMSQANETWLADFTKGFNELLETYQLELIGGDITRGPLAITLQVHGFVPPGEALQRNKAKIGDKIYVTGCLGAAALAVTAKKNNLKVSFEDSQILNQALNHPMPRIAVGIALRNKANAAIDISDGLSADLNHILEQSGVGASIYLENIPFSPLLEKYLNKNEAYCLGLNGGDDYELCFTIPAEQEKILLQNSYLLNVPLSCIGIIEQQKGLRIFNANKELVKLKQSGYQHFS